MTVPTVTKQTKNSYKRPRLLLLLNKTIARTFKDLLRKIKDLLPEFFR